MDGELTESDALVHCFAEFTLLPKLLDAQRRNPNSPRAWMRVLDANGYNDSHIDSADMPPDPDTTSLMFNDAFRFCKRIALTGRDGRLTENGTALADLSAVAFDELDPADRALVYDILAECIQDNYRGANGLRLIDLLQFACAVLTSHGHRQVPGPAGLLLAEMETLIHWGGIGEIEAYGSIDRLLNIRLEVAQCGQSASSGMTKTTGATTQWRTFAELVSDVHWSREELAAEFAHCCRQAFARPAWRSPSLDFCGSRSEHPILQIFPPAHRARTDEKAPVRKRQAPGTDRFGGLSHLCLAAARNTTKLAMNNPRHGLQRHFRGAWDQLPTGGAWTIINSARRTALALSSPKGIAFAVEQGDWRWNCSPPRPLPASTAPISCIPGVSWSSRACRTHLRSEGNAGR